MDRRWIYVLSQCDPEEMSFRAGDPSPTEKTHLFSLETEGSLEKTKEGYRFTGKGAAILDAWRAKEAELRKGINLKHRAYTTFPAAPRRLKWWYSGMHIPTRKYELKKKRTENLWTTDGKFITCFPMIKNVAITRVYRTEEQKKQVYTFFEQVSKLGKVEVKPVAFQCNRIGMHPIVVWYKGEGVWCTLHEVYHDLLEHLFMFKPPDRSSRFFVARDGAASYLIVESDHRLLDDATDAHYLYGSVSAIVRCIDLKKQWPKLELKDESPYGVKQLPEPLQL